MAIGDGEGSPEIYNVATKLDQAYKGFQECYKMIQQSKALSKHFKKRKSDLYQISTMDLLKALASNTNEVQMD